MSPLIRLVDDMRAERKGIQKSLPQSAALTAGTHASASAQPLVAVTMGSDSDLPVLKPGLALLKEFGIPFFVTITSAHRTPHRMIAFAESAAEKGFKVRQHSIFERPSAPGTFCPLNFIKLTLIHR